MASPDNKIGRLIRNFLLEKGFTNIEYQKSPNGFFLNPDYYAKNRKKIIAIYVREKNIPLLLIQKIAQTKEKNKSLELYLLFKNRPKRQTQKEISLFSIGVLFRGKKKIELLCKSKNFSKKKILIKKKEKKKSVKMHEIGLFPSSIQGLKERKSVIRIVNEIRDSWDVPIFCKLVEKNRKFGKMNDNETEKTILDLFQETDIFVCVLTESFRVWVNFEIRNSVRYFKNDKIIIFIKSVSSKRRDKKQTKLIEWIEKQEIKYLPYLELKEFESLTRHEIHQEIKKLYSRAKAQCPF